MYAALLLTLSCTGDIGGTPSSPTSARAAARLDIAPTLSSSAIQAYGTLAAMGIDLTSIRIRLVDLRGAVARDTVIAFPADQQTLSVVLPLSIQGTEQQFNAIVELRDASGTVQFSGTARVIARGASRPALAAVVTLQYVGPGASAKTVTVSPAEATVVPGASQALVATAADQSGAPVPNLVVSWSSSDTTVARVTPTGSISATATSRGPRGTVTFTARTPGGAVGTAKVTVLPQAARLVVTSGNGQRGVALGTLATPFTVEVQATDGGKVAGALVNFRAVTAGGEVSAASVSTDASGRATTLLKLGRTAGAYAYEASSGTLASVTVGATATAAPVGVPTQLIPLTPLPTSFKVGVEPTQRFSAQLADANGYFVLQSGVSVTATMVVSPGGATTSVTVQSDASGVLTFSIPAFKTAGSVLITLTSPVMQNLPFGTFPIVP
ncbi:hypothetical protein BH11GEM1_BH11GEM1_31210 [soil metagenome]